MFFLFALRGKTGTDGSGRSKKLQEERKKQTPFMNFKAEFLAN
jgi:hypothetical protein